MLLIQINLSENVVSNDQNQQIIEAFTASMKEVEALCRQSNKNASQHNIVNLDFQNRSAPENKATHSLDQKQRVLTPSYLKNNCILA